MRAVIKASPYSPSFTKRSPPDSVQGTIFGVWETSLRPLLTKEPELASTTFSFLSVKWE